MATCTLTVYILGLNINTASSFKHFGILTNLIRFTWVILIDLLNIILFISRYRASIRCSLSFPSWLLFRPAEQWLFRIFLHIYLKYYLYYIINNFNFNSKNKNKIIYFNFIWMKLFIRGKRYLNIFLLIEIYFIF